VTFPPQRLAYGPCGTVPLGHGFPATRYPPDHRNFPRSRNTRGRPPVPGGRRQRPRRTVSSTLEQTRPPPGHMPKSKPWPLQAVVGNGATNIFNCQTTNCLKIKASYVVFTCIKCPCLIPFLKPVRKRCMLRL
jgi:hypothetical protein